MRSSNVEKNGATQTSGGCQLAAVEPVDAMSSVRSTIRRIANPSMNITERGLISGMLITCQRQLSDRLHECVTARQRRANWACDQKSFDQHYSATCW